MTQTVAESREAQRAIPPEIIVLAGCLIAEEAGGHVARFDGSPYLPAHREGGLIIATDANTWDLLRREVFTL